MATQAIRRAPVGAPTGGSSNTLAFLVYITALVLGLAALLVGLFTHSLTPRARGGFTLLGAWAIVSAFLAFFYRSSERQLGIDVESDGHGHRARIWTRIGVDGWAAWAIFGLLAACIIGILGWR